MSPTVGLMIVDTESYVLVNNAIQHCVNAFAFNQVTVFSNQIEYWPQYRTVEIAEINSVEDYNRVILQEFLKYVETDFLLGIMFKTPPQSVGSGACKLRGLMA